VHGDQVLAIALALGSSVVDGLSDFLGGLESRSLIDVSPSPSPPPWPNPDRDADGAHAARVVETLESLLGSRPDG
jgi:hypothetical protein